MKGTVHPTNRALIRPILIGGVERRLVFLNGLLSFPLIAATHFRLPAALLGIGFFVGFHVLLILVTKYDPCMGSIFKRNTRYIRQQYYPARSHVLFSSGWAVQSITLPR